MRRSTHSGVERDGRDEVDVLKAAETFPPGDVPQPDRLIHGRGEEEEVLDRSSEVLHCKSPKTKLLMFSFSPRTKLLMFSINPKIKLLKFSFSPKINLFNVQF